MYLQSSVGRPVAPRVSESAAVETRRLLAALASSVAVSPQSLSCSINKQKDRVWLTKIYTWNNSTDDWPKCFDKVLLADEFAVMDNCSTVTVWFSLLAWFRRRLHSASFKLNVRGPPAEVPRFMRKTFASVLPTYIYTLHAESYSSPYFLLLIATCNLSRTIWLFGCILVSPPSSCSC